MKKQSESELLQKAATYCSTAERCVSDVRKKIRTAGADTQIEEQIIAYLLKEKFIDETRYCRSFVNDKLKFNQWGRIRITHELRKKEIEPIRISEALDTIDEKMYLQILSELLKTKKRVTKARSEQEIFYKLYRYAAGKGFESNTISKCLKPLFNEKEFME